MKTELLQSVAWLRFQEAAGKQTLPCSGEGFSAHGIVHTLPFIGQYLYIPRGPQVGIENQESEIKRGMQKLLEEAKKRGMKWVRIDPETEEILQEIKKSVPCKVVHAAHDMQPREIFKVALSLSEAELLAQMKSKTRYNIRLAEKRGVQVFETREQKYRAAFLDLITATSGRKGITAHSRDYYEHFFAAFPEGMCRLFVAEYQGEVLVANLVLFYGDTVTYLHGGSSDQHRDVMAPYLLQWEQIKVAKKEGYHWYDFGGIKTTEANSSWSGITKFKTGFAPGATPTTFPGSYDLILESRAYFVYVFLSKVYGLLVKVRKLFV